MASTNGTAAKVRTDKLELGYAQALADIRRAVRSAFEGDDKAAVNDVLDQIEDGRAEGVRIEEICRNLKKSREGV